MVAFRPILAVNHAILEQNCFGNNYEGSIPFTRSIDKQGLTKMCKYSASKVQVIQGAGSPSK